MNKQKALTAAAAFAGVALLAALRFHSKRGQENAKENESVAKTTDCAVPSSSVSAPAPDTGRIVLPTNVRPEAYRLCITPNFTTFVVDGSVSIDLIVKLATNTVVLHSKGPKFSSVVISGAFGKLTSSSVSFNVKKETASLTFPQILPVGPATLDIEFVGELQEQLHGFYRSAYTKDGEKRYMGTTQFEATHAREAFPCWDEPEIKAKFAISLCVAPELTALSNMPVISEEPQKGGKVKISYAETPLVSTYLLAWVIGEFDYVSSTTRDGTEVRVYTQEGKTQQGMFALETACKVLSFFTDYFAIGFPLPKMDMIAIPDFAAGAMENWGLVTYRETALLFDPELTSSAAKERVAYVVAHELAHQWFGNLVSPEWWKYLWLNEGFATWAGKLATDALFPEWHTWDKFVADSVTTALRVDALESSHPIEVEVRDGSAISEIFDAISYYKGSSIIRMLANYLGADTFRAGLRTYLKAHQYSCATTEDLWQHLSEASGKDIAGMMDNWIKTTGYPYVSIRETGFEGSSITLQLSQSRFLASGGSAEGDETLWHCPVGILIGRGETELTRITLDLTTASKQFMVDIPDGGEGDVWVKANVETSGFFRIKYGPSLLARLSPYVQSLKSVVDRMFVQTDIFALAEAGETSTADALEMATGYRLERDYSIWADLSGSMGSLRNLFQQEGEPYADDMQALLRWLYQPLVDFVGWDPQEDEPASLKQLRSLAVSGAAKAGNKEVIDEAMRRFKAHVAGTTKLPSDLRTSVFSIALSNGGETEYEECLALHDAAEIQEHKVQILRVLGNTPVVALLKRTLDWSASDAVRSQDTIYGISSVARNPVGRGLAWDWLRQNWDMVLKTHEGGQMLANFVKAVCAGFASQKRLDEVTEFFDGKALPGAERALDQVKEKIAVRMHWLARDRSSVAEFFAQRSSN